MKKTPDLQETLAKGAAEAMEVLQQTANLIEAEWQRLVDSVDESETIPDSVKSAVGRFGETVEEVRDFVVAVGPQVVASGAKAARQAGMPIPEEWTEADAGSKSATDDDVVDGEVIEDTIVDETGAEDAAATKAEAKPKAKAKPKKTKAAGEGSKASTSKASTSKAKPSKAKASTSKNTKTKKN